MITASAAAIASGERGSQAIAPWVSTTMSCPAARALCSSDSAAMYVWAIPVGHDVTATSLTG